MNKKISIAIDAMGGENAPFKNIKGISLFCDKNKGKDDFFFNIFGKKEQIEAELKKYNIPKEKFNIFHTETIVSDNETPLTAVKTSKSVKSSVKSSKSVKKNVNKKKKETKGK